MTGPRHLLLTDGNANTNIGTAAGPACPAESTIGAAGTAGAAQATSGRGATGEGVAGTAQATAAGVGVGAGGATSPADRDPVVDDVLAVVSEDLWRP